MVRQPESVLQKDTDPLLPTTDLASYPTPRQQPENSPTSFSEAFSQQDNLKTVSILHRCHLQTNRQDDYFPLDAPEVNGITVTATSDLGIARIRDRQSRSSQFRQLFFQEFLKEFPDHHLHHQAIIIADALAPDLNAIFLAQMEHASDTSPRSWHDDAPQAVEHFQETLFQLRQICPEYFEVCQESGQTLSLVAEKLVYASSPKEIEDLADQLEHLGVNADKKGHPFFLVLPSDVYTFPDDGSLRLHIAEAGIRLIFLITGPDKEKYMELINAQSKQHQLIIKELGPLPHARQITHEPQAIIGTNVPITGGDQCSWSTTSGEAFTHVPNCFMYSPGMDKSIHLIRRSFYLAGLPHQDHSTLVSTLDAPYTAHEIAHPLNNLSNDLGKLPEELAADILMLATNIRLYMLPTNEQPQLIRQVPWENFIAAIAGEAVPLSTSALINNGYVDGYTISAIYQAKLLYRYGLINITPDNQSYSILPLDDPSTQQHIEELFIEINKMIEILYKNLPGVAAILTIIGKRQFRSLELWKLGRLANNLGKFADDYDPFRPDDLYPITPPSH